MPPDHYNPNDPYIQSLNEIEDVLHDSDILAEAEYFEESESALNTDTPDNNINETKESSHHIRTLPPDHFNPNDHYTESNNLATISDGHKIHIFHTEIPSNKYLDHDKSMHSENDNNARNELYTSFENSLTDEKKYSDKEQKHDELIESSPHDPMEYKNTVYQNEDKTKSNDENFGSTSVEQLSENLEPENNFARKDKESRKTLQTQNQLHSDETKSYENAQDPDINPETVESLSTEFLAYHVNEVSTTFQPTITIATKVKKIRKSRIITITTPMSFNSE